MKTDVYRKSLLPRTKVKKPPPPVTAIIGFTTADFLVMASDGQVTYREGESSVAKRFGEQKIIPFRMYDEQAMLAVSGDVAVINLVREMLDERMEDESRDPPPAPEPRGVANEFEKILKRVRDKIREGFDVSQYTDDPRVRVEALDAYFRSMDVSFILGYYFGDKSLLYTADIRSATTFAVQKRYVTSGSGSNIANMILEGRNFDAMKGDVWIGLAAYAIEMCKNFDPNCGGRLQIGVLQTGNQAPPAYLFTEEIMKLYEDAANEVHRSAGNDMIQQISDKFRTLAMRTYGVRGLDGKPITS